MHRTMPGSILWPPKLESDDFDSFLWVLDYELWGCRGSRPIFPKKFHKAVRNKLVMSFSRPVVPNDVWEHSMSFGIGIRMPTSILWTSK